MSFIDHALRSVFLLVTGLGLIFIGMLFQKPETSTPITAITRGTSDSLTIEVNNPGPDTLWIGMLARDNGGHFFTSRLKPIAPGARFTVADRTDVLRGFRLYDSARP